MSDIFNTLTKSPVRCIGENVSAKSSSIFVCLSDEERFVDQRNILIQLPRKYRETESNLSEKFRCKRFENSLNNLIAAFFVAIYPKLL